MEKQYQQSLNFLTSWSLLTIIGAIICGQICIYSITILGEQSGLSILSIFGIAIGTTILGAIQWILLKNKLDNAFLWILGTSISLTIAITCMGLLFKGFTWRILLFVGMIVPSGVILGLTKWILLVKSRRYLHWWILGGISILPICYFIGGYLGLRMSLSLGFSINVKAGIWQFLCLVTTGAIYSIITGIIFASNLFFIKK